MKWFWLLMAVMAVGCAGSREELQALRPLEAPGFLNGDLAAVFGGKSFGARVEVGSRSGTVSGELFGREGSLYLQAGDLSGLWDGAAKVGYQFSDPLQGYAPMAAVTNEVAVLEKGEGGLPVRIEVQDRGRVTTLTLSKVRMGAAAPGLFVLPNGFKRYESTGEMGRELMVRQRDSMDARARAKRAKWGDAQPEDGPVEAPRRY